MKLPIVIHTDEDYDRAQQRVKELNAMPDSGEKDRELQALAEAMLAFELRRDEAGDIAQPRPGPEPLVGEVHDRQERDHGRRRQAGRGDGG